MNEPKAPKTGSGTIAAVAIGRNEGERLLRCLRSLVSRVNRVVYVDSGSTDGSADAARALGAEVVELDMTQPFTMARGRNAGFDRLREADEPVEFVQFIDGDCEIVDGWIEQGRDVLMTRPEVAVVSGRRRERAPEASVYHRLTDIEWDRPAGDCECYGGDAMMRVDALAKAGGFRDGMIAGEEAELSVRLRRDGWTIVQLGADMTLHDIAMTRFSQWWKRAVRSGHAYAEGVALHGAGRERHHVRPLASILTWALLIPVVALAAAWPTMGWSLLLLVIYPLQIFRVAWRSRRRLGSLSTALLYATFCMIAKWPQLIGQGIYWGNRLVRRRTSLIEYKDTETPAPAA